MVQIIEKTGDSGPPPGREAIVQCRLIVGCLAIGSLLFAGVVLVVNAASGPVMGANAIVGVVLAGIAAVMLLAAPVIGAVISRELEARKRNGETLTIEQITGMVIVRAALIEGPALLGGVAGLLAGVPYLLITAVACAGLLLMWLQLPDRMRALMGEADSNIWRP